MCKVWRQRSLLLLHVAKLQKNSFCFGKLGFFLHLTVVQNSQSETDTWQARLSMGRTLHTGSQACVQHMLSLHPKIDDWPCAWYGQIFVTCTHLMNYKRVNFFFFLNHVFWFRIDQDLIVCSIVVTRLLEMCCFIACGKGLWCTQFAAECSYNMTFRAATVVAFVANVLWVLVQHICEK